MKRALNRFVVLIIIFTFSLPDSFFAEDWEDEGRSVQEMLGSETYQKTNDRDAEEIDTTSVPIQESVDEDEALFANANDQNIFWLLFQMFLALAFVLFLIYGLLKFINTKSRSFRSNTTIESIGGVPLGSNRSVQIVRVGKKLFVVGVGDSIQLIKEIEDEDEVTEILENHRPQEMIEQPLTKVANWWKERSNKSSLMEENQSFENLLNKELQGVKKSQEKVHSVLKEKDE